MFWPIALQGLSFSDQSPTNSDVDGDEELLPGASIF